MDSFSTGLGGALIGRALPQPKAGPAATLAVTSASVLPDVDVFFDFFVEDPLFSLTVHRGFTHSLLGVAVMAPLLAVALWRFSRDKNYPRLLALVTLGLLWHLFTDLATSWGTMVFSPFDRTRVVWDLLFIIDFIFTAILLLPHLEARIYRQRPGALRRGLILWLGLAVLTAALVELGTRFFRQPYDWGLLLLLVGFEALLLSAPALRGWGFRRSPAFFCRVGLVALVGYLGVCAAAHQTALARVKAFSATKDFVVEAQAALPQPLSPFRWSGLVLTPEGVYQSWFNVFDNESLEFEFFPHAQNRFVQRASTLPPVKTYLWFARFPQVSYRNEPDRHVVEYSDLRFRTPYRPYPFVFRVVLNRDGQAIAWGML
jgi:membrane-bound metal-dependent hydrolase YbcI (DUF457 family)